VIEIGDYFFKRVTVVLDHGQGLVSPMYNHLSRIDVAEGRPCVARGEKMARSAKPDGDRARGPRERKLQGSGGLEGHRI